MAEAVGAGEAIPPGRASELVSGGTPATGMPIVAAAGQLIAEPPPLVEPIGFDPPASPQSPSVPAIIAQRPMRRHFLAPVARAAVGESRPLPDVRLRPVARSQLAPISPSAVIEHDALTTAAPAPPRSRAPAETPAPASVAAPQPMAAPTPAAGHRTRRRLVAVLAVLGLILATGVGIVVLRPQWLAPLRDRVPLLARVGTGGEPMQPPADPSERFAYFMQRARAGNPQAELAVAVQYAKGEGISRDYVAAAKWFQTAADAGVTRAQYDLGVLYEHGRGVPLDYTQAVNWYRRAAEGNHPLAQYNLAVAYTKGEGVTRNFFDAAMWYDRAALQGVIAAMVNLAILYERGEGVEVSNANAYAWYRAAARRGSQPAAQRADELLQAFSPADQTQAEAKTREIALSIRDAVGDAARRSESPDRRTAPTTSSTNLRSGFASDVGTGTAGDGADVNP